MNKEKWTKLWYDPFDPFDPLTFERNTPLPEKNRGRTGKMACKSVWKEQSQEKGSRRSWARNQMGIPDENTAHTCWISDLLHFERLCSRPLATSEQGCQSPGQQGCDYHAANKSGDHILSVV
jgi:hypothetical protein